MAAERLKTIFNISYHGLVEKSINFLPDEEMLYGSKSNDKSLEFKNIGNNYYKTPQSLDLALDYYNKALAQAEYNGEFYGIALANRSAVFFEKIMYKECLLDIEECLNTEYPENKRQKLYERLHKCKERTENEQETVFKTETVVPSIFNKNPTIFGANNSIEIAYSEQKGRHIIATKNLQAGEILFVVPAFAFAPIFKTIEEFKENKCYHCLKNIVRRTPCKSCSITLYCSSKCRDESWNENHRWECLGMKYGFWYKIGLGFLAFKTLIKGLATKLDTLTDSTETHKIFGNDYKYFASLQSHLEDMADKTLKDICDISAQIVRYLELKTDFFKHCFTKDKDVIALLLVKHMAQLSCNATVVEHLNEDIKNYVELIDTSTSVASGIFLSISLMNHSCKPNIIIYYIEKYIIVKALTQISKTEEICNSYGINYGYSGKQVRQEHLKDLYYFDCLCSICSDDTKEFKNFNSIYCPECNSKICLPIEQFENSAVCTNCDTAVDNFGVIKNNSYVLKYPELLTITHEIHLIILGQLIHKDLNEGAYISAFEYLQNFLQCLKGRVGEYHIDYGISLFIKLDTILESLVQNKHENRGFHEYMQIHRAVEKYLKELKTIFEINYPHDLRLLTDLEYKFETLI